MKITGIWITKNSEKFIGYSIASLINHVDEIIVVDADSKDNTHQIITSFKSPKVRLTVLDQLIYDIDDSAKTGFSQSTGDVVMLLGDDYIWDEASASRLREYCTKGIDQNKKGLLCSVYNMDITPNTYFSNVKKPSYILFEQKDDPLRCTGSFLADHFAIAHTSETRRRPQLIRGFNLTPLCQKKKRYLDTPLFFSHWKYQKDTKEYFIQKYLLFKRHSKVTREEAEQEWDSLTDRKSMEFPHQIPNVLFSHRKTFTPLGGFDIADWNESEQ